MPEIELLEGHRMLLRSCKEPMPVRSLSKSLRPYLGALHSASYVGLAFDWDAFDAVVIATPAGIERLDREREDSLTPL
jgi:hypothetical protein